VEWLIKTRNPDGTIPYLLNGKVFNATVYQPIAYSTEGFIAVDLHLPGLTPYLSNLNLTVDFLVRNQNIDGTWGELLTADGERSIYLQISMSFLSPLRLFEFIHC
jgi:hypothetical protein